MRAIVLLATAVTLAAGPVSYDIVSVRAPRLGDSTFVRLPDVFAPTAMPPGSDRMLLHPDGSEETLFAAGKGAVLDPAVSFDANWVNGKPTGTELASLLAETSPSVWVLALTQPLASLATSPCACWTTQATQCSSTDDFQ